MIKPSFNPDSGFTEIMKSVKTQIDSNPSVEYMEYKASDKASSLVSVKSRKLDTGDIQLLQDHFLQTKRIIELPKDSKAKVGVIDISQIDIEFCGENKYVIVTATKPNLRLPEVAQAYIYIYSVLEIEDNFQL